MMLAYDCPTTVLVRSKRLCPRSALLRILCARDAGEATATQAPHAGARPVRPLGTLGGNAARAGAGAERGPT